jgi:cytochrome c biogenesis protein CcdA
MTFSTVLDVVIGLSLVYLSASLFVTTLNEYVNQLLRMRAKQLVGDLAELISDKGVRATLRANPALAKLFPAVDGEKVRKQAAKKVDRFTSSYIDTKILAQQIVGGVQAAAAVAPGSAAPATMASIVSAIAAIPGSGPLKGQLLALAQSTDDKVEKFVENVSAWADQSLTMMGEVYKRKLQLISFVVGFAVAAGLNLDTVTIVSHLWHDEQTRAAVAAYAGDFVEKVPAETFNDCLENPADESDACALVNQIAGSLNNDDSVLSQLPIGYPVEPVWQFGPYKWLGAVPGWLLTALATALGAPFWFDLLNRVVNVRHAMRKPQEES